MKKTSLSTRILAMVLILVMTIQLLPLSAFATFGELQSWNPGVDLSTLKQDDAINWPIKVYDYLSDGMLFEWMDTNTTTTSSSPYLTVGHTDGTAYVTPYGGGYKNPATALGSDFTYAASTNYSTSNYNSPYYYSASGCAVSLTKKDAVDFKSPYYLRISDNTAYSGSGGNHNMLLNYFSSDQSTKGNMRYMVLVYRANKVEDYYCSISLSDNTAGDNLWDRNQVTIPDSSDWTYVIFDTSTWVSSTIVQWVWLTFHTTAGFNTSYKGMNSGAYLDLTHIGYFADKNAAENYGEEAVKFDKNPGEYLAHQSTTTYTHSYVTPTTRGDYLDHIFSLNYRWKVEGKNPKIFGTDDTSAQYTNVWYGMDFTTHSTDKGWKTNAYTSDTFWTWSNGTTLSLKNTVNNVTRTESVSMSNLDVEQKTQANGAQYVRLTNSGVGKILLSKFREDQQQEHEGYVPKTNTVNYMVLVYRANGLDPADKFGLWAHGYLNSSSTDDNKTANYWKYAGLTKEINWQEDSVVKQLSFEETDQWSYMVVPITETIAEKDDNMTDIDWLSHLGMYLPALTNGKSLDIAYVSYFKSSQFDKATDFGTKAVNYMNAAVQVTQDVNTSKTYTASRRWYGGGNKSFGMLYSSGGGQYWPGSNSGGESTSTNQYNYGYEFDTWMIGYRTNAASENSFNTARYNLVFNETTGKYEKQKFTANYTPSGTGTGHANSSFQPNASGTTNNIYFVAATEETDENGYELAWGSNDNNGDNGKDFDFDNMRFDGYQLLQTMTAGVMTAGLLEGSLQTVTVDGKNYRVPVYRQETVEYIAYNLLHGLRVPMKDSDGNYNTRYIKGTASTKYGGVDLNGDGQIGWINYDGDSRNGNETNEASVDLATALRHELGLTPRLGNSVNVLATTAGVDGTYDTYSQKMGSYQETLAKSRMLYGEFSDCRNAIDTAMDAAYYLLNNIFISESYNQEQDDYEYLTLSSAQVNALGHSGFAFVFDAGFTTGKTAAYEDEFTDDGTNKSAIKFDPYNAEGTGAGTISMEGVTGKTRFDYGQSSTSWTTRFPFLPVTDAEGDFAGQTQSYYFLDDAQRIYTEGSNSYKNRNFNYVIASNGEFVYREEDDLFFEFEGDDDVYLFINGELVLDIGGAHSITSVYIDVNDYVNAAATALAPLAKYGYHKDMTIDQFDQWISASQIQYLDKEFNPTGEVVANPYSAAEIAQFKRQHKLNLSDGQICQFDFYYMERHGWGANMRIVTNMHITDPKLKVEKSAHQFGEEIEYGGVIDPTSSVEYNFTLTNTGNQKLYNLSWRDDVLGITMDPETGLNVDPALNGIYVMNASGGYLQPKDMYAVVSGKDINGNDTEFRITFDEVANDGGQEAFRRFLKKLESNDGTSSGFDDAEITNAGSGLWVGGTVRFGGIYYMLTPEQTKAGQVDNTVYLQATTRIDPATVGNRNLRSNASHRLYTNGFPVHYQWAGHEIFMNLEHLLEEAKKEAERDGSQLSLYQQFFKNVTLANLVTVPCDKFGRVGGDYTDFLNAYTDPAGHNGYLINYEKPGVYTFYLLMYMKNGKDNDGNTLGSGSYNASNIAEGYYAILRSQVFVADVKDSVYVLDYGLSTESLDADGLLFKDDYLFGPNGMIRAKLLGLSGGEDVDDPQFRYPSQQDDATKTGIYFTALDDQRINTPNGFFNANLSIPNPGGKEINYDANKGQYTLTEVGTMKINAVLPTDMLDENGTDRWSTPYLYYWYDDGTTGPAWPGTPMKKLGAGKCEINIPADVSNIIINNGSAALKTADLKITPGLESTVTVTVSGSNVVSAHIETIMEEVTMHVKVPEGWGDVYLHHWHDDGESTTFPGDQITEKDAEGYYTIKLHGDVTNLLINNGAGKQTGDLRVYAGKEAWIDVSNVVTGTNLDEEGNVATTYYDCKVKYTQNEGFKVHASVPMDWKDTINLYYWRTDGSENAPWPGVAMTKGEMWYTLDELVPADVSQIIINNGGNEQTVNLTVTPGLETWIMVQNDVVNEGDQKGRYNAKIAYGSETDKQGLTFTPTSFLEQANEMWLAIAIHGTNATPSAVGANVDIHHEVQMYKKVTVLPATVVYYEDTFGSVNYNEGSTEISFAHHGNGSGQLSQSVDPDQPYGQDETYQDTSNDLYSGDSLTEVEIRGDIETKKDVLVSTFEFTGTGFEIISRTNAADSASFMARVYKKSDYTADAYDKYMEEAYAYLDKMTKIINVETAYANACIARQEVADAYDAYKAVEGTDEYDAAYKAYEDAVSNYMTMLVAYQTALQAHTPRSTDYPTHDSFEMGTRPTAPIADYVLVDMTYPTVPESPFVTISNVYTQFDHGNNGGAESINQVPVIRITDLELGEYVVEIAGLPLYTFDPNNNYEVNGVQPTKLYLDGYRIYQPMGPTNDAYSDKENGATVEELRDLIAQGSVGVGLMQGNELSVSTGTTTWTESLHDNDFDSSNKETFHSIKVGSTADYLIQGPNNEVYMEGNATNSALIFYVKKDADADVHELQIAVRGLDYGKFYGAGSTALNAQLQYGILGDNGYMWKNLVRVVSGTEQYYSIPYEECPVDTEGRYQIVLRAVNPQTNANAMVSYTNVKLNGLTVEQVEGIGEGTVIHYQNGILVKPDYELIIIEDASFEAKEVIPFTGRELTIQLEREWTYVFVRSTMDGQIYDFFAYEDPGQVTSATLWRHDTEYGDASRWTFDINAAIGSEITFTIKQPSTRKIELSYCLHSYGQGVVTREPNCTDEGITSYYCSKCDHIKNEPIAIDPDAHEYSGGVCKHCGKSEPKFYLVGYINGKNYGCEQDYLNMGEYLFVDGKLEVRFEKDSYVYVKADGNKAWYMTSAYVTEDTAVLGDTTTGSYTEKMYVPCGVDLILTLSKNDDGTLTLHYEEPCKHSWSEGIVTKQPTCTEDGERSYTCLLCFETKTEMIPATGHNYVDGVCQNTGCGEILYRTIYFENTDNWENVYLYAWVENGATYTNAWPGDLMTPVEGQPGIYSATVPAYLKIIFNDGGSVQTDNLDIPEDADTFNWTTKLWRNLSGHEDYYLVGSINGVDYGFGDNANNMGIYKFEDGKLKVSFTKESYVFVKTTGNAKWFMCQTYCDTYAATLYNTETGANEKMFIPGGTEIEFTLTVNDDGTVDLVAHSWGSVVTKQPTCTEEGERTYTCYLCNDSYQEVIEPTGHSFVNDVCTVCGHVDTRIIYFKNTAGWENVYIYTFTEGTPATEYTGEWPGTLMNLVEGETDLYYYEVSAQAKSVIFNTGINGVQTDNLRAPTDENNKYTYGANVWTPVDEDVEIEEPQVDYIYFAPGAEWPSDNAWFAAYFFGNGDTWVKMENVGDGIYRCAKPEGFPNVIFCRMNKEMTDLSWDAKWNQTVDLTIPADSNLFTITNPWNGPDGKAEGTWSAYVCDHSYSEKITTAATCTTVGTKTFTCSKCGDKYTEEIPMVDHSYADGACTVCGGKDPAFVDKIYLHPEGWSVSFETVYAAYFFNDYGSTWVQMVDKYGNDYHECEVPEGYTNVIFVWMTPGFTELGWDQTTAQTIDLTVEVGRLYTIPVTIPKPEKYTGSWGDYDPLIAECLHDYEYVLIDAGTCTTYPHYKVTCKLCGDEYEYYPAAPGHNFVNGTCTVCGKVVSTEVTKVYLKPSAEWSAASMGYEARFWEDFYHEAHAMTDEDGDGIYECEIPAGTNLVQFWNKVEGGYKTTNRVDLEADRMYVISSGNDGYWADFGSEVEEPDKVYLQPGASWQDQGAWFAAWFPGAETWATMTDSYGNGYYQCQIPEGATGVIFVRMNPEATEPNWDQKWNQTVDLSVEANRLYVIENPWNESYEWKATGSWTDYNATVAECSHSYTEEITLAAGCTTTGVKTFTCSKCSISYTQEIAATGHNYVDGTCSNCGEAEPTEPVILYLKPNDNWNVDGARFAAYFFDDLTNVWVDMTDPDGDGIYQCEAVSGYSTVIYCRMNPGTTENNWDNKWNQTGNLTVLYNGYNLCTINDGEWDCGSNVTWSNYVATTSYSLRMTRSIIKAMSAADDSVIAGDDEVAMNLSSIHAQMSSDVVFGECDEFVSGEATPEAGDVTINSATLVLSDDINMNYYVTVPENAEDVYMVFQMNGETTTVTDYTVMDDGRYCFRFNDINAQKMGDNICATVYATVSGQQITDCVERYSVRAFCLNRLVKNADDAKMVSLISDLLVYGEKTQLYLGYKTNELVTSGLDLTPSTFTKLDESFDKLSVSGTADEAVRYSGVTLALSNKVLLRLTVQTADPAAFTYVVNVAGVDTVYTAADLVDAGNGKYYLYFDGLKATAFDEIVTATILSDGQAIGQSVTYSVNTFIYRNQNTEDVALRELLEAIYNYGVSAQNMAG